MKSFVNKRGIKFCFILIAAVLAVISLVRFSLWAPEHNGTDMIITCAIVVGVILDIYLIIKDNEYIMILSVAVYSIGAIKLLTNSVGSFVDAIQGINMFGDSSQVSTILSISILLMISVLLSIIAAFMKKVKA